MSLTDDLYREIILEHFRSPRNSGRLENPTLISQGVNPFCGDELELTVALEGDVIRDLRVHAKGCSISQASASMMSEVIQGKAIPAAEALARQFKAAMLENTAMGTSPEWEDLQALEGVKKYPARIKCAILSWNTLLEGIEAHRSGKGQATHVEGEEGERPDLAHQVKPGETAPAETTSSLEEQAREVLKSVIDPELNMNVVDLGLIYGVDIQNGSIRVTYTLTSPGCPLGPIIQGQIQSALSRLPWVKEVHPDLVWQPPWDPRTMASEEVKTELGIW